MVDRIVLQLDNKAISITFLLYGLEISAILHASKIGHRGQGQGMFHGPRRLEHYQTSRFCLGHHLNCRRTYHGSMGCIKKQWRKGKERKGQEYATLGLTATT